MQKMHTQQLSSFSKLTGKQHDHYGHQHKKHYMTKSLMKKAESISNQHHPCHFLLWRKKNKDQVLFSVIFRRVQFRMTSANNINTEADNDLCHKNDHPLTTQANYGLITGTAFGDCHRESSNSSACCQFTLIRLVNIVHFNITINWAGLFWCVV